MDKDKATPAASHQKKGKDSTIPAIGTPVATETLPHPPLTPNDILIIVEQAIREHIDWIARFHRVIICYTQAPRDIISEQSRYLSRFGAWVDQHRHDQLIHQPVMQNFIKLHDQMRDDASFLASKHARGQKITETEYSILSDKIHAFFELAKRVQDAFQHAYSNLDPLTGLHNRHMMRAEIERERQRALRTNTPGCLAIADIDHFKAINDTYGHAQGDCVLQGIALRLISGCRPYDQIYRYGGEEFLLCLPNAGIMKGKEITERLRGNIARLPFEIPPPAPQPRVTITISLGVVEFRPELTLDQTIQCADEALYLAKKRGRNRVCCWSKDDTNKPSESIPSPMQEQKS